jgi:glycosyltransferase involved in cell wall biosynthesis
MHIAEIAPLAESVPPKLYGGTERVVHWLTEELITLGDKVTLFASGGSTSRAEVVPVCPKPLRLGRPPIDPTAAISCLLESVARRANEFDVIHCHLDWIHLPLFRRLKRPFVTTLHGRLDLPFLPSLVSQFNSAPHVSISNDQRRPLPDLNYIATIYHGLPERLFMPNLGPQSYLAFLGRLSPEKGAHIAIQVAREAGLPLRIAAKIPRHHSHYFKERIEPFLGGHEVEFIGEVNDREKQSFLGNAMGLLFPIDWPEPFGLVMIEAMACGTPVIAWRRGSVPEIIENGITGFVVETEAEVIDAVKRLGDLDRRRIRSAFERRFTARHMAESYRRCFEQLLSTNKYPVISRRSHLQTTIQESESPERMPEIDPACARPPETPSLPEDGRTSVGPLAERSDRRGDRANDKETS